MLRTIDIGFGGREYKCRPGWLATVSKVLHSINEESNIVGKVIRMSCTMTEQDQNRIRAVTGLYGRKMRNLFHTITASRER